MSKRRALLCALVICGTATTAMGQLSPASAAPGPAAATVMTSDDQPEAGKCRWVWGKGVICETPTGTIGL